MERAFAGQHQSTNMPIINIVFNDTGARKFGEITTKLANTPDLLVIEKMSIQVVKLVLQT